MVQNWQSCFSTGLINYRARALVDEGRGTASHPKPGFKLRRYRLWLGLDRSSARGSTQDCSWCLGGGITDCRRAAAVSSRFRPSSRPPARRIRYAKVCRCEGLPAGGSMPSKSPLDLPIAQGRPASHRSTPCIVPPARRIRYADRGLTPACPGRRARAGPGLPALSCPPAAAGLP